MTRRNRPMRGYERGEISGGDDGSLVARGGGPNDDFGCIRTSLGALSASSTGHTPTKTESVRNPVSVEVQKALDLRRRFTLIRLRTLFNRPYATSGVTSRRVRLGAWGSAEARGACLLRSTSTVRRAKAEGRRR